jgi:hypothetical protein
MIVLEARTARPPAIHNRGADLGLPGVIAAILVVALIVIALMTVAR